MQASENVVSVLHPSDMISKKAHRVQCQGIQEHCGTMLCHSSAIKDIIGQGTRGTHFLGDTKVMSMLSLQGAHAVVTILDSSFCKKHCDACDSA